MGRSGRNIIHKDAGVMSSAAAADTERVKSTGLSNAEVTVLYQQERSKTARNCVIKVRFVPVYEKSVSLVGS